MSYATEVCRYNWHSAGSLCWPFSISMLKYKCIFANKIYGSNFIKQHLETGMIWKYQKSKMLIAVSKKNYCVIYYNFRHTFVSYWRVSVASFPFLNSLLHTLVTSSSAIDSALLPSITLSLFHFFKPTFFKNPSHHGLSVVSSRLTLRTFHWPRLSWACLLLVSVVSRFFILARV